jgi:hypothetical protein
MTTLQTQKLARGSQPVDMQRVQSKIVYTDLNPSSKEFIPLEQYVDKFLKDYPDRCVFIGKMKDCEVEYVSHYMHRVNTVGGVLFAITDACNILRLERDGLDLRSVKFLSDSCSFDIDEILDFIDNECDN